jgi:hypothetical protein
MFAVAMFVSNTTLLHFLDHPSNVIPPSKTVLERLSPANIRSTKNALGRLTRPPRINNVTVPFGSCAILLFGLPRAFQQYVLPSLIQNVIQPNLQYGCDYFVHYYHMDREISNGRSGRGGVLHTDDIQLLTKTMQQEYENTHASYPHEPHVGITNDTNETFWENRQAQLMKYRNTRNKDGSLTYFPYTEPTYVYPDTIDNIVKQWHSIDSVWNLMEDFIKYSSIQQKQQRKYLRVAMMRSDVMYITPIDLFASPMAPSTLADDEKGTPPTSISQQVIIPDFAKYPINDRLIIGPYEAVKVWATQRFPRIDHFAKVAAPGTAMHSETFLNASILTSIKNDLHMPIYEDPWICFLRVRADGAIWIEDCDAKKSGNGGGFPGNVMEELHPFLPQNLTCRKRFLRDKVRRIRELICEDRGPLSRSALAAREMWQQKRVAAKKNQFVGD